MEQNQIKSDHINKDLTLFLIRRELKTASFIRELSRLGFDPTAFSLDLDRAILLLAGFQDHDDDDLLNWYYRMLEVYSEKLNIKDETALYELALEFYLELRIKLKDLEQKSMPRIILPGEM